MCSVKCFFHIIQTKVRVKATACGQAVLHVHAQVPLADHVCGIPRLLHELRQQFLIQRNAVRLAGPDDLVLHTGVDLKFKDKHKRLRRNLQFSKKGTKSLKNRKEENNSLCGGDDSNRSFKINVLTLSCSPFHQHLLLYY